MSLVCPLTVVSQTADREIIDETVAEDLYKIALFVSWPHYALNYSTIQFCFYKTRLTQQGETFLDSRRIKQRRISIIPLETLSDASSCHLLYSQTKNHQDYQALKQLSSEFPILTINPNADFVRHGGMIQFDTKQTPKIVRIHKKRLESSYLAIDASLLMLANEVIRK